MVAEPLPPSVWFQLKKLFVEGHVFFPPPSKAAEEDGQLSSLLTHTEALVASGQWKHGLGSWKPLNNVPATHVQQPEVEIVRTLQALLADIKPETKPKSVPKVGAELPQRRPQNRACQFLAFSHFALHPPSTTFHNRREDQGLHCNLFSVVPIQAWQK